MFALYRCQPSCVEEARLSGGIGTAGEDVRVSIPLAALGAAPPFSLASPRIFAAVGEAAVDPVVVLDEVEPSDAAVPVMRVEVGVAPASAAEEDVAYGTEVSLVDGEFWGQLDVSSLPAADYRLWARACLGEVCGAHSAAVTL